MPEQTGATSASYNPYMPSTAFRQPARLLAIVAAIALAIALLAGCQGPSVVEGEVNLQLPDITLEAYQGADVIGGEQVLLSDVVAQGKPVVLNFYAALCPPCRAEMPDFERVYQARRDEFTLVGLDIGPQQFLGSREEGQALLDELDITYPAGTTFEDDIVREFRVVAMPTTIFIRPDGSVERTWSGLLSEDKINEFIDEIVDS